MKRDVEGVEKTCIIAGDALQKCEDHVADEAEIFRWHVKQIKRLEPHQIDALKNDVIIRDETVIQGRCINDGSRGRPRLIDLACIRKHARRKCRQCARSYRCWSLVQPEGPDGCHERRSITW